ncbi:uncharacterized protein LOC133918979 [Phragmites australis]|uniref:uncharacterized protein LOC133918979 n=1 Tax=Phragmites australis TaxID=29695 RepID=UPI002D78D557|nr:uncharacterized protein LOC133918979 [Phragmites australis]
MDLAYGRDDAPNGGAGAEVMRRRKKKVEMVQGAIHGFLEEKRKDRQEGERTSMASQHEEEEGLLSSLLTKMDAVEKETDLDNVEPESFHPNSKTTCGENSKEVELADIAKDLNRIKRQNMITHILLGTVIVMTAVWQVNEVSFLLWAQKKLSNPFKSLGDLIKGSIKGRGRKPVIETSPLPPVGIPDVTRADLPTLVISDEHR